jgi:hypothetical protein
MKKAYTSWKAGKHKNVGCVECHYPPERMRYSIPQHKEILSHYLFILFICDEEKVCKNKNEAISAFHLVREPLV